MATTTTETDVAVASQNVALNPAANDAALSPAASQNVAAALDVAANEECGLAFLQTQHG